MLKNQSLQTKLISGFLVIGFIVLIVGLIGWNGNNSLKNDVDTFAENALPSIDNIGQVKEGVTKLYGSEQSLVITALTNEQRQKVITNTETAQKNIKEGFAIYDKLRHDDDEDKIYKKVLNELDKWQSTNQAYMEMHNKFLRYGVANPKKVQADLLKQGKNNTPEYIAAESAAQVLTDMNDYVFSTLEPAYESASNAIQDLLSYNRKLAEGAKQAAEVDVSRTSFWIWMGLIIGPLLAGVFGVYFSNTIAKPMGAKIAGVVGVAEKVSLGDLTTNVETTEDRDEVGRLMVAFRTMTQNLNNLVRQVQQSALQITTSGTQISASGKELEATMAQQVASTNQVAATAREIATNSQHLTKIIGGVEQASKTTGTAAGDSQKDLLHMESTMQNLVGATSSIAAKLGVISDKANSINSIVTTITKVADQTNLLSLNAAIEAEKAGEYGTGFAVVAREIRRLADQTAVATLDIENMVREMQGAVSTGVMEMDKFSKEVEQGVEDVGKISHKLESIIEQVQNLTPRFAEVSNSMESQSQGAGQISEAMVQLSESSAQTAQSLREINSAINQLNDAAQALRQSIAQFKIATA